MADEDLNPSGEIDTGEPVEIWSEEELPADEFVGRLRRRIHRRVTSNQVTAFSWHTPGLIALSLVDVLWALMESFGGSAKQEDRKQENP